MKRFENYGELTSISFEEFYGDAWVIIDTCKADDGELYNVALLKDCTSEDKLAYIY